MPSFISFKRMLNSSDDYQHPQLRNSYSSYASNGAKNVSWGGSFKTNFINQIRSAKSFNSAYSSYNNFRVLSQSATRTRIGYQVIFNPASSKSGDYTFVPTGGVSVSDPGAPWLAKSRFDGGTIDYSGITVSGLAGQGVRPRNPAWAYDGTNFAFYDGGSWYTSGNEELANTALYWNGRKFGSLLEYYDGNRFGQGVEALFGGRSWTAANLILG